MCHRDHARSRTRPRRASLSGLPTAGEVPEQERGCGSVVHATRRRARRLGATQVWGIVAFSSWQEENGRGERSNGRLLGGDRRSDTGGWPPGSRRAQCGRTQRGTARRRSATSSPSLRSKCSDGSARGELLGALDIGASWEAWDRLRTTSGILVRGARRVMSLVLESPCAATARAGRSAAGPTPRAS